MKYAEVKKLADLSDAELSKKCDELYKDDFGFRMQKGLGQFGQTHVLRETRKDIARIKTVLRQRQLLRENNNV